MLKDGSDYYKSLLNKFFLDKIKLYLEFILSIDPISIYTLKESYTNPNIIRTSIASN